MTQPTEQQIEAVIIDSAAKHIIPVSEVSAAILARAVVRALTAPAPRQAEGWQPIETAPKKGCDAVLVWTREGPDFAWYESPQPDGPQEMGHDGGWWGSRTPMMPGRSIGHPDYFREPECQPIFWQQLEEPPSTDAMDEFEASTDPNRCIICGWPLAQDQAGGCVPGDCSYRPDDPAEQGRLRVRRERFKRAVRATCCDSCDYPDCGCTASADVARRAIQSWEGSASSSKR